MSRRNTAPAQRLSPYEDVNRFVASFVNEAGRVLKSHLTGMYLTGSLSYGDFNCESSDIDITVIVDKQVSADELKELRRLHLRMEDKFPKWARRLECTYTPVGMLASVEPPKEPRPWYWGGEGRLFEAAQYGNEWIINNYLLYEHGIRLRGPEFRELMPAVSTEEVRKACIRDLFTEWEPKRNETAWFENSHYASYFVLNLCRILYTVMGNGAASKSTAAGWVIQKYGDRWGDLIGTALGWHYGVELDLREPDVRFLDFVIEQVAGTELYAQMRDEVRTLRGAAR